MNLFSRMPPLPHLNGFEQLPPRKREQAWQVLMKMARYQNEDGWLWPRQPKQSPRRAIRNCIRSIRKLSARSPPIEESGPVLLERALYPLSYSCMHNSNSRTGKYQLSRHQKRILDIIAAYERVLLSQRVKQGLAARRNHLMIRSPEHHAR